MDVKVVKGECTHICHSQEQLKRFLAAGWQELKETPAPPVEEEKKKKTTKAK